ncbi:MAG: putative sugar O-methyltransferase [Granulosicoccus sp.]
MHAAVQALIQQNALYHPGSFWADATTRIVDEILADGIENFRALPTPLQFFVPTYGQPGNRLTPEITDALHQCAAQSEFVSIAIEQLTSGYSSAFADYRVLMASQRQSGQFSLAEFSESLVGNPIEQFVFDGRRYSRSSLNYLLGLAMLQRHIGSDAISTVVEVGGGFGSLGEILLKTAINDVRYIDFDLPPNSSISEYYLSSVFGSERVSGYSPQHGNTKIHVDDLPRASVFCNWQIEQLIGQADLFVNFISFQEMEPDIVANYLEQVDRLQTRWVLLRNMREGKQKRTQTSIGVQEPVMGDDYQRMLTKYELVEANVFPFGYRTLDGFHSELQLFRRR